MIDLKMFEARSIIDICITVGNLTEEEKRLFLSVPLHSIEGKNTKCKAALKTIN